MSSRAEYLSKYTSGGSGGDHKKKKRKKVAVVVQKPEFDLDTTVPSDDEDVDEDGENTDMFGLADETRPVKVLATPAKQFKGFKRIDNGQTVDPSVVRGEHAISDRDATKTDEGAKQNQTVYRDSEGRIIDIEARRAQHEAEKQKQQQLKEIREIRLSEDEQIRQAKQRFREPAAKVEAFDDPMTVFDPQAVSRNLHHLTYTKGVNPVNRFDIKAGCLWDGIDRSNGFEELYMRKVNEKKFTKIDEKINESYDLDFD